MLGQTGPSRLAQLDGTRRDVVTLIDDDDIPPGIVEVVTVFEIVLQGIDGDDAAVVVIERLWSLEMRWRTRARPTESRRTSGIENRLHHSF
jgi:hypothetical protein